MLPTWSTACPDWERRIVARESLLPAPIFPNEAARALALFKRLRVTDIPGQPTFGECCASWVFDFVSAVFGAYDAQTGRQLIREYYLLVSKKNSKSVIAAGIMLTALVLGERHDEEHLILAPTKEVADNSFRPAASMVRADPNLAALLLVQDHVRTITHRIIHSSLKVVAADTDSVAGKKAGRILVDEHWLFGARANAESMFMEATGGQVSRNDGWVVYLTTQSDGPPAGVFRSKLNYHRAVRDGKIVDNKSLGLLYEFPQRMIDSGEYLKPENFYITNPNLGRSVNAEWLRDQLRRVQDATDGRLQQFLAKHLNVEIGMNLRSDRWAGADYWIAQDQADITLDYILAECEVVDVGIDGGGLDDLLGFAVVGRLRGSRDKLAWTHAWAHPSVLERRKSEAPRFLDFERQGDLTLVDQIGHDVREVAALVARIHEANLLDRVGVDPAGLGGTLDALAEADVPADKVVGISQGWKLSGAIKTVERWLAGGELAHAVQPMMAWCVSNAKVVPVGNAINITKKASGTAKIDPLMALFNAASLMALNPTAMGASVYESRGIRFL